MSIAPCNQGFTRYVTYCETTTWKYILQHRVYRFSHSCLYKHVTNLAVLNAPCSLDVLIQNNIQSVTSHICIRTQETYIYLGYKTNPYITYIYQINSNIFRRSPFCSMHSGRIYPMVAVEANSKHTFIKSFALFGIFRHWLPTSFNILRLRV